MKQIFRWFLAGAGFVLVVIGLIGVIHVNEFGTKWDWIGWAGFLLFMFALDMIFDAKIDDLREELRDEFLDNDSDMICGGVADLNEKLLEEY